MDRVDSQLLASLPLYQGLTREDLQLLVAVTRRRSYK
jgi:hypothetical protein